VNGIDGLHHVGHVVADMQAGLDLFARLGFLTTPPSYPALPRTDGGEPRPFGVGNSHAPFATNFVELLSRVHDDRPVPAGAHLAPLEVPPTALPLVTEMITKSVDMVEWCLTRFEGVHILAFETSDIVALAARLTETCVDHGGVVTVQHTVDGPTGPTTAFVRFLEVAPHEGGPSRVPEGRLAVAEPLGLERPAPETYISHPNGATALEEAILCVADDDLLGVLSRYALLLGRDPRSDGDDDAMVFDLDGARLSIVTPAQLDALLPGERPRALPGFVAYAVAVYATDDTREFLEASGLPVRIARGGDLFVPSKAALGANVIFRESATTTLPGDH
jgi:hypothetical protein